MPQVPDYPQEDWMKRLGRDSGSRQRFAMMERRDVLEGPLPRGESAGGSTRAATQFRTLEEQRKKRQPDYPTVAGAGDEPTVQMNDQEKFMYQHHKTNLEKGGVKNPDGTTSTYKAIGVESDGKYYMLPTVWDNKVLSSDEAIKRADKVGLDKFPSYGSQDEAEKRYKTLHDFMEMDVKQ